MGIVFWIKYSITFPIRMLLFMPYWFIKPFSENKALGYVLRLGKIDDWIFK